MNKRRILLVDDDADLRHTLVEQLETLPEAGAQVSIGEYDFEVLQIGENTIRTVRARKTATAPAT